jgi:hypothetical protein
MNCKGAVHYTLVVRGVVIVGCAEPWFTHAVAIGAIPCPSIAAIDQPRTSRRNYSGRDKMKVFSAQRQPLSASGSAQGRWVRQLDPVLEPSATPIGNKHHAGQVTLDEITRGSTLRYHEDRRRRWLARAYSERARGSPRPGPQDYRDRHGKRMRTFAMATAGLGQPHARRSHRGHGDPVAGGTASRKRSCFPTRPSSVRFRSVRGKARGRDCAKPYNTGREGKARGGRFGLPPD